MFASELLRTQRLGDVELMQIAALVQPLSEQQRSLGGAFRAELQFASGALRYALATNQSATGLLGDQRTLRDKVYDGVMGHFTQFGAMEGRRYDRLQLYIALDSAPSTHFLDGRKALPAQVEALRPNPVWAAIYDPMGNFMLDMAEPNWSDYTARMIDLEGIRRLVNLQLEMKRQHVVPADVPTFLKEADASLTDPYTGQPMQWDAKAQGIYFTPNGERTPGWLPLPIG